jgi:hypothetical protein
VRIFRTLIPRPRSTPRHVAAPVVALILGGCTWIELTDAGAAVAQGTAGEVAGCELIGDVTATTQDRVVLKRGRGKVAEELIVLARNEAATLGGDTVVPRGPMEDGRQTFDVYRCGPAG